MSYAPEAPHRLVLLFAHFGDQQMRGSERCLINLFKGLNPEHYETVLWCNQPALRDLASPYVSEVHVSDFTPPIGFGYPPSKRGALLDYLKLRKDAHSHLKRLRPDLIICNSLAPCQWMVPASIKLKIPLLCYLHTNYLLKSRLLSFVYGATHVVGVSHFTLQSIQTDAYPLIQQSVVYNGVEDLALQRQPGNALRQQLGIQDDEFVFASVCALVEWKKLDIIIDGFRRVVEAGGRPCALLVVGEGPCRVSLQAQAQGLRIIFCGWRTDIADLFAVTDCVVVAAEREAFGLTVAEAASMSLPVICAKAGGPTEIVIDGHTGLFAEPGNPKSFAQKMLQLKENPALCMQLGQQARGHYESNFGVEKMTSGIAQLIDTLVSNAKSAQLTPIRRFTTLFRLTVMSVARKLV